MILRQALALARERFSGSKDADSPALESEVLLRHVLGINRVQLFLELDKDLDPDKEIIFQQWIERRLDGEPVAYIIHCREFFGLDFYVDNRVLIPRPETETLIEESLKIYKEHPIATLADIGTGSGAIAVSLALNMPQVQIFATDISSSALEVADINCRRHNVSSRVTLLQGDLLDPLPLSVDILIANLPYVQKADITNMPSAAYEPKMALDGGESGLDKIFQISDQLQGKVRPGGHVLLEIGMGQSRAVVDYLRKILPTSTPVETKPDLSGLERVVKLRL